MAFIKTGCQTLDDLLCGGVPTGVPLLIFGMPNLGKTWLCFQLACMCTRDPKYGGLGKKVLYLDTESFFVGNTFDMFYGYFKKRWPDLPDKPKIELEIVPDIFTLGRLFGVQFEILQEDKRVSVVAKFPTERQTKIAKTKGKLPSTSVQREDWKERSPIWQKLSSGEYGMVVIDSITVPIKSVIPSTTQNLPARTSLLQILLGAMYTFARGHDVSILITNHVTRNPMNPGYHLGVGDPWGGQNVTYYVKYQFGLYKALKDQVKAFGPDGHRLRRIQRYRMPGKDEKIVTVMLAKDTGYVDLPKNKAQPA